MIDDNRSNSFGQSEKGYEVIGLGNPMIDIYYRIPQTILLRQGIVPGKVYHHRNMQGYANDFVEMLSDDRYIDRVCVGGGACTTMRYLDKRVAFYGFVGSDSYGDTVIDTLHDSGVAFLGRRCDGQTGVCRYLADEKGVLTIIIDKGVLSEHTMGESSTSLFDRGTILYVEGFVLSMMKGSELLMCRDVLHQRIDMNSSRISVVFDLGSVGIVRNHRDILLGLVSEGGAAVFGTEEEFSALISEAGSQQMAGSELAQQIQALLQRSDLIRTASESVCVIKRGKHGAVLVTLDKIVSSACPEVVETAGEYGSVGAGDVFAAGFLSGMLAGDDWGKVLHTANLLAGNYLLSI